MDPDQAELIVVLDELLLREPTGEEGQCPWCRAFRAPWLGSIVQPHGDRCPWARLGPAYERLVADELPESSTVRVRTAFDT